MSGEMKCPDCGSAGGSLLGCYRTGPGYQTIDGDGYDISFDPGTESTSRLTDWTCCDCGRQWTSRLQRPSASKSGWGR